MSSMLAPWHARLREAQRDVASAIRELPQTQVWERYGRFYEESGGGLSPEQSDTSAPLVAAALLGSWLVARAHGGPTESLCAAEKWLFKTAVGLVGELIDVEIDNRVCQTLSELPDGRELDEVLPYALEAFEEQCGRATKRQQGVFYTPADVAEFVAVETLHRWRGRGSPKCLDPACGTGVLLRAVLDRLIHRSADHPLKTCTEAIHGIDLSAAAAQSAAFVLLSRCMKTAADTRGSLALASIRRNIVVGDSTVVAPAGSSCGTSLDDLFPFVRSGFDIVVGNPPFTALPSDGNGVVRTRIFRTAQAGSSGFAPLYTLFVEMMWRFTNADSSAAGMVLPMSLAYHSGLPFVRLRREMAEVSAGWQFYFFDRTPDSLFGDDVKTRNSIALMERGPGVRSKVSTSRLSRWNSRNRHELFESLPSVALDGVEIGRLIPKLGAELELDVYRKLIRRRTIESLWVNRATGASDESSVYFSTTAYNWLPIRRALPVAGGGRTPPTLGRIYCRTSDDAWFTFSVLSSAIVYWLWRVTGDGFHLNRRFLASVPVHPMAVSNPAQVALRELGRELWRDVQGYPYSAKNGGVTTWNYNPLNSRKLVSAIDRILIQECSLPDEFADYLDTFVTKTIAAGRD